MPKVKGRGKRPEKVMIYMNRLTKPRTGFVHFSKEEKEKNREEYASKTFGEIAKLNAAKWNNLTDEQKQFYISKTEAAKKLKKETEKKIKELEKQGICIVLDENKAEKVARTKTNWQNFCDWYRADLKSKNPGVEFKFGTTSQLCGRAWQILTDKEKDLWKNLEYKEQQLAKIDGYDPNSTDSESDDDEPEPEPEQSIA